MNHKPIQAGLIIIGLAIVFALVGTLAWLHTL